MSSKWNCLEWVFLLLRVFSFLFFFIFLALACSGKRLLAAWRLLIGVWGPREWDLSLSALRAYSTVEPPPPNPWLDQYKQQATPTPSNANATLSTDGSKKTKIDVSPKHSKRKRLGSRHFIRHVLRARLRAIESLSSFLKDVECSGGRVRASVHLAERFSPDLVDDAKEEGTDSSGFLAVDGPKGWRDAKEVLAYLRSKGAVIEPSKEEEGEWAAEALSSGDEGEGEDAVNKHDDDETTWVAASLSH